MWFYVVVQLALAGTTTQLVTGEDFSCALHAGGTVECWGNNEDQQLGLSRDDLPATREPVRTSITGATDLSASAVAACVTRQSGDLTCWGQVARASWGKGLPPTRVPGAPSAVEVSLGSGARGCVRFRGGKVSCWEESGDALPALVGVANVHGAEQIAVGRKHACARVQGGSVWCWGDDRRGQLGQGKPGWPTTAVPVPGLNDAVDLSVGDDVSCAVRRSGQLVCWGPNHDGHLGLGHTEPAWGPQTVPGLSQVVQVKVGIGEVCARTNGGKVQCWGADPCPRPDAPSRRLSPVELPLSGVSLLSEGGHSEHTCALVHNEVTCWGFNSHGQALAEDRCISR